MSPYRTPWTPPALIQVAKTWLDHYVPTFYRWYRAYRRQRVWKSWMKQGRQK